MNLANARQGLRRWPVWASITLLALLLACKETGCEDFCFLCPTFGPAVTAPRVDVVFTGPLPSPPCVVRLLSVGTATAKGIRVVVWNCDSLETIVPDPDSLAPGQVVEVPLDPHDAAGRMRCGVVDSVTWIGGSTRGLQPRRAEVRFAAWRPSIDSVVVGDVENIGGSWADSVIVLTESRGLVLAYETSPIPLYGASYAFFTARSDTDATGRPIPPKVLRISWLDPCGSGEKNYLPLQAAGTVKPPAR